MKIVCDSDTAFRGAVFIARVLFQRALPWTSRHATLLAARACPFCTRAQTQLASAIRAVDGRACYVLCTTSSQEIQLVARRPAHHRISNPIRPSIDASDQGQSRRTWGAWRAVMRSSTPWASPTPLTCPGRHIARSPRALHNDQLFWWLPFLCRVGLVLR